MDSYEGSAQDPLTLHEYLYGHRNPVNCSDPSGHSFILDFSLTMVKRGAIAGGVLRSFLALATPDPLRHVPIHVVVRLVGEPPVANARPVSLRTEAIYPRMSELVFEVTREQDGGFCAECLSEPIFTQGVSWEALRQNIREAVRGHYFDQPQKLPTNPPASGSRRTVGQQM